MVTFRPRVAAVEVDFAESVEAVLAELRSALREIGLAGSSVFGRPHISLAGGLGLRSPRDVGELEETVEASVRLAPPAVILDHVGSVPGRGAGRLPCASYYGRAARLAACFVAGCLPRADRSHHVLRSSPLGPALHHELGSGTISGRASRMAPAECRSAPRCPAERCLVTPLREWHDAPGVEGEDRCVTG
jgi:hypothetical protein